MSLTRYRLDVVLVTTSPIHSGGPEEEVDRRPKAIGNDERKAVPQQFARNASGTPVLTGRSVKGALRAAFFEALDRDLVEDPEISNSQRLKDRLKDLWGREEAKGGDDAPSGWASALTFETVSLEAVKKADSFMHRPGIAIDRYWGSVGDGALFFHEVAPEGQKLHLGITAEVDPRRFAKGAGNAAGQSEAAGTEDTGNGADRGKLSIEQSEADVKQLFAVILGLLGSGRVAFGKRKGAGWGRVKIDEEIKDGKPKLRYSLTKARLDDVEGLRTWLKGGEIIRVEPAKLAAENRITIVIEWESPTGILVAETDEEKQTGKEGNNEDSATETIEGSENQNGSDTNRKGSDAAPQNARSSEKSPNTQKDATKPSAADKSQKGTKPREGDKSSKVGEAENDDRQKDPENVARPLRAYKTADDEPKAPLVLPGSSVRGALRTRASRIARTILYRKREDETPDWSNVPVHDQLANDPTLVRALFGTTERRGAVTVLDTLSKPSEAGATEKLRTVTHNAGDRWTGGVIDGGLYGEEYPVPKWNVLRIEVDPERIVGPSQGDDKPQADAASKGDGGPRHDSGSQGAPGTDNRRDKTALRRQQAAICLLGLTLAELATGTLPLGSRGTRGMGQVKVKRLTVKGPEDILPLPAQEWDIHDDDGESVAEKLLAQLRGVNQKLQEGAAEGLALNWTDFLNEKDKKA